MAGAFPQARLTEALESKEPETARRLLLPYLALVR